VFIVYPKQPAFVYDGLPTYDDAYRRELFSLQNPGVHARTCWDSNQQQDDYVEIKPNGGLVKSERLKRY
jgi:hypothetical protein